MTILTPGDYELTNDPPEWLENGQNVSGHAGSAPTDPAVAPDGVMNRVEWDLFQNQKDIRDTFKFLPLEKSETASLYAQQAQTVYVNSGIAVNNTGAGGQNWAVGLDTNTGASSAVPLLTLGKAFQLARNIRNTVTIVLCSGKGGTDYTYAYGSSADVKVEFTGRYFILTGDIIANKADTIVDFSDMEITGDFEEGAMTFIGTDANIIGITFKGPFFDNGGSYNAVASITARAGGRVRLVNCDFHPGDIVDTYTALTTVDQRTESLLTAITGGVITISGTCVLDGDGGGSQLANGCTTLYGGSFYFAGTVTFNNCFIAIGDDLVAGGTYGFIGGTFVDIDTAVAFGTAGDANGADTSFSAIAIETLP